MNNPKTSSSKRKRDMIDVDKATASVDTAGIRNQTLTHKKAKKAKKTAAVNHELANTVSDMRAAYLEEFGNRTLYIISDPFPANSNDTDSAATPEVRAGLKARLVDGITWEACKSAYNSNGGKAITFAGVEKQVKLHGWKWFDEQNVVVPWTLRGPSDRKRLKNLGLGQNYFPTLVAKILSSTPTVHQPVPKAKEPTPINPNIVSKNSSEQKETTSEQHLEKETTLTPDRETLEQTASNLATDEQQPPDDDSKQDYVEDKVDSAPLLIRDRIRITHNLFGSNVVEVKLDDASHWATLRALEKYCDAYSGRSSSNEDQVVDFGRKRISPVIARAFFHAISPFPQSKLSTHDVIPDPEMSLHHEDVALVILPDDPKPKEIECNFDACAEMYRLARMLKSPVVKDMVADRIMEIYLEYCKQLEEDDDKQNLDFPVRFANSLKMNEDLPILRLLVDIALDHSRRGHDLPDGLATHVMRLLVGRSSGWGDKMHMLHNQNPTALCNEYHGHDRLCHKAFDARYTTERLIHDIFKRIRRDACLEAAEEFDMEEKQDEDDDSPKMALDIYKMLLWSRDNEEQVVLFMLEYERLAANGLLRD
ncbi:hypothetical protein AA0111_g399 [Alternaria arborescens]|uniref:hypothetical protein n=1 Tax=Alternaria arborescens TaxID=156630 RepID=UPI001074EF02|nr:hypothetical protein AA0111_g399 [Alternaria arborescens]RYO42752.1 hypothetical protein AA0111_g399 [Alternaria arborescens]